MVCGLQEGLLFESLILEANKQEIKKRAVLAQKVLKGSASDTELKKFKKLAERNAASLQQKSAKINSKLKSVLQKLNLSVEEREESSTIMQIVKLLFYGIPRVSFLVSPQGMITVLIVWLVAKRKEMSLSEAFKKVFNFTVDAVKYKWSDEYKKLYWKGIVLQLLGILGITVGLSGMLGAAAMGDTELSLRLLMIVVGIGFVMAIVGIWYTYAMLKYEMSNQQ